MSNIIQLLERIGQDASLQDTANLTEAVNIAAIPSDIKKSILEQNSSSLERQLDICPDIVAFLLPAENEDDKEQENEDDKESDQEAIRSIING